MKPKSSPTGAGGASGGTIAELRLDSISYSIYTLLEGPLCMAKSSHGQGGERVTKPVVWLHGEVKSPPFTKADKLEAGMLLRLLQEGEVLGMPQAEVLPSIALVAERFAYAMVSTTGGSCSASIQTLCSSWTCIRRRLGEFPMRPSRAANSDWLRTMQPPS